MAESVYQERLSLLFRTVFTDRIKFPESLLLPVERHCVEPLGGRNEQTAVCNVDVVGRVAVSLAGNVEGEPVNERVSGRFP